MRKTPDPKLSRHFGGAGFVPRQSKAVFVEPGFPRQQAFTLIELILVLALLAIATSLIAPSLFNFFRGRAIDSEARQFLALTHAGQSRAVAEGFPMLLWIDAPAGSYGLEQEFASGKAGTQDADPKAQEFTLDGDIQIQAVDASPLSVNGRYLPAIRFLPDGTIDDASAATVCLTGAGGDSLWLVEATNHLGYEIRATNK